MSSSLISIYIIKKIPFEIILIIYLPKINIHIYIHITFSLLLTSKVLTFSIKYSHNSTI